jgi:hypothetical protein
MKLNIYILSILLVAPLANAQQPETSPSQANQPIYSSSPKISGSTKTSEHCNKLRAEVDKLTGKPQRRYAAMERYKAECTEGRINQ